MERADTNSDVHFEDLRMVQSLHRGELDKTRLSLRHGLFELRTQPQLRSKREQQPLLQLIEPGANNYVVYCE